MEMQKVNKCFQSNTTDATRMLKVLFCPLIRKKSSLFHQIVIWT